LSAVSFSVSVRREVDGEEVEVIAGDGGGGSRSRERGTKQVGARDEQTVNLLKEEVIGNTDCMKSEYESPESASVRGGERVCFARENAE